MGEKDIKILRYWDIVFVISQYPTSEYLKAE